MKNVKHRMFALLVALLMVVSLFAGCAKTEAPAATGSTASSGTASGSTASSSKTESEAPAEAEAEMLQVGILFDDVVDGAVWRRLTLDSVIAYGEETGKFEVRYVEGQGAQYFEQQIRSLADECDIVFTMWTSMAEPTIAVAKDYPDVYFCIMDGFISDLDQYANIMDFGMDRVQAAYLGGIAAAMESETGVVGIVGGVDEPVINEAIAGWQQGLVSVNPDIVDYVMYANTWGDVTIVKEMCLELVDRGCDVIAAAASGGTPGCGLAAEETDTLYVAWDNHFDDIEFEQCLELGCVANDNGPMFKLCIDSVLNNTFPAGQRLDYGIDTGASWYDILDDSPISDETRAAIEEATKGILDGTIELSKDMLHK